MTEEELHREIGDDNIRPCSQLNYEADRQAAMQRILEGRLPKQTSKTVIMMQAPGMAEAVNLIDVL